MIEIFKPTIVQNNGRSRCTCEIHIDNDIKEIWFEVESKYGKYLCNERADAYVIGILNYAMKHNHTIKSHVPVTEELLYNINKILIPSLVKHSKNLSQIEIITETASGINSGSAIGTGCSCGIDSFSAIYNHVNTKYKEYNLTHLCINNVGAYNECYSEYGIEKVKSERYQAARKAAKEIGLELIETDSNFSEIIEQEHLYTHTYSSVFAIYMLQKLWKKYFYASSGLDYSHFSILNNDMHDCSHYELLSLQCFSTQGLRIYSEGGEKSRLEKTKDIVDYTPAHNNLHVCLNKPINCGICPKCMRTLVTLDFLNKLNEFKNVFDINYYKENRKIYYKWLYRQHCNKEVLIEEIYQQMNKRPDFRKSIKFYKIKKLITTPIKKVILAITRKDGEFW